MVELNGYVIIVVEGRDNKIKLYGSPADKDNLEVGDEILDVNERKLEDLPRAEVIRYIHEVYIDDVIQYYIHDSMDPFLHKFHGTLSDKPHSYTNNFHKFSDSVHSIMCYKIASEAAYRCKAR